MEGISLIEGKELEQIKKRLEAIAQNQMALIRMIQQLSPIRNQNNYPGYISIQEACSDTRTATSISTTGSSSLNSSKVVKSTGSSQAHLSSLMKLSCKRL